jgi:hypothetical protein
MGLHLFDSNSLESDPLFVYCSAVLLSDKNLQIKAAEKCTGTTLRSVNGQSGVRSRKRKDCVWCARTAACENEAQGLTTATCREGISLPTDTKALIVSLVGDPPRTTLPKPFALIDDIGPRSLTSEASCHGCQLAVVFCLSLRSAMLRLSPKIVLHEDAAAVRRLSS